jgi:hypothetical protein
MRSSSSLRWLIAEAEVEQVNFSEVEKKMLQFTEAERATHDSSRCRI